MHFGKEVIMSDDYDPVAAGEYDDFYEADEDGYKPGEREFVMGVIQFSRSHVDDDGDDC